MVRQMKYFQSVVRNNSFSEAAEECHISQSAISQQIQALERELEFYQPYSGRRKRVYWNFVQKSHCSAAVHYTAGIEKCALYSCIFQGAAGKRAGILSGGNRISGKFADYSQLLRILEKRSFGLLCRSICRYSKKKIWIDELCQKGCPDMLQDGLFVSVFLIGISRKSNWFWGRRNNFQSVRMADARTDRLGRRTAVATVAAARTDQGHSACLSVSKTMQWKAGNGRSRQMGQAWCAAQRYCPGRPGTADEIANVAELLMGSKGAFIIGSTILIDGGATASYFYGSLKLVTK